MLTLMSYFDPAWPKLPFGCDTCWELLLCWAQGFWDAQEKMPHCFFTSLPSGPRAAQQKHLLVLKAVNPLGVPGLYLTQKEKWILTLKLVIEHQTFCSLHLELGMIFNFPPLPFSEIQFFLWYPAQIITFFPYWGLSFSSLSLETECLIYQVLMKEPEI